MANDLNNCSFIGRLVEQPELRHAADTAICNFTLACGWKTSAKEGTEYILCVSYGKLSEIIAEYAVKGQQLYVSGRQSTRKYEKDGQMRYSTEINVDKMQLLAKPQGYQAPEQKSPTPVKHRADRWDGEESIPF